MIKIGFSTHKHNLLSAVIRWFTKSEVSHCWLLVDDPFFGAPMVLEASEVGLRLTNYADFKKANDVVFLVETPFPLDAGVHDAWGWLGSAYDFGGLFGMSFVMLGRWLKQKWGNPFASKSARFCSEAIVQILQDAKYPGSETCVAQETGPQDLLDFLRGSGAIVSAA